MYWALFYEHQVLHYIYIYIYIRRSNQLSYEATDVGFIAQGPPNVGGFIAQLVAPVSGGNGFKPRWSLDFFRRLYAIA